jgi:hypothetical protein
MAVFSRFSRPKLPLLFLSSSSSILLTRLSGPRSSPTPSQKIWQSRESNQDLSLDLQPGTLTTRQQRRSTFFYITYINSVRTSQEAQHISVVQSGTLTTRPQRRSTFFHITYMNSVRTSQEAQHISVLQSGTLTTRPQRRSISFLIPYITAYANVTVKLRV